MTVRAAGPGPRPRAIVLHRVSVPLRTPLVTAHGVIAERDVVLVEWQTHDGAVGWGECPTLSIAGYSDETTDVAWAALVERLGPAALVDGPEAGDPALPMASGALRDAALDASLRAAGRSLVDEVRRAELSPLAGKEPAAGDSSTRVVPMCRVVGLDAGPGSWGLGPGEVLLKVKVSPATIGRLREVRDAHPDLALAADANGSFGGPGELPAWLDDLDLAYLEQPFPATMLEAHAAYCGAHSTPVALDESLPEVADLRRAIDAGAVDVVSVKPARLGGVRAAVEALELAAASGLDAFVGGMVELSIGRATAAAGATHPAVTLPTDLGPSERYVIEDVTEPIVAGADGLVVPGGPGCGRAPDRARLAEVTTDRVVIATG